MVLICQEALL
nr:unnamed protein product [Callosobruchus chinensis]